MKRKGICGLVLKLLLVVWISLSPLTPGFAAPPPSPTDSEADLTDMSLEDLMDIEITSAAKKAQRLSEASSAIFVITQEDIRRSGVTNIPDALRMVPGVQVARIDANKWAVTARGFHSRFANKLLVLIDGRAVYDPIFSGVFWDVQDVMLEDVERIEVIRGPGATLWGANAVNGVINIITQSAWDTQGGLATAGAGNQERGFASARYGIKFDEHGALRIYAKGFKHDDSVDLQEDDANDDWYQMRAGFRSDWSLAANDTLTFQGDIYDGEFSQRSFPPTLTPPFSEEITDDYDVSGGNVLARWQHTFADTSTMALQLYYDRTERDEVVGSQERDTFDIDLQHQFGLGGRQEIIWGLGYRYTSDDISADFPVLFDPESRSDNLFSAFIQDDISLVPKRLNLILGSKFEHNDYTGFEVQPTARVLWTPSDNHSLWAAVSRAVRTPSRFEEDVTATLRVDPATVPFPPFQVPVATTVKGNSGIDGEDLLALELGYRLRPRTGLSFDVATFYNIYKDVVGTKMQGVSLTSIPPTNQLQFDNDVDINTYGVEVAADWQALDWWRVQLAYTYFRLDEDSSTDVNSPAQNGDTPDNQLSLRSSMNLPKNVELDGWLRYVDNLSANNVDSYTTLDVRLAWRPRPNLELTLVGQNLFDPQHPEFIDESLFNESTQVERGFYSKITWRF